MIRKMLASDVTQICNIYNHYIENTCITFEVTPVSHDEMRSRFEEISNSLPWYVFEEEDHLLGFAYASPWKGRCAYRFSVETTVYLKHNELGKGIGTLLYKYLLEDLQNRGFHVALGGIALPNEKSQALHEKLGFTKVAHFYEVGFKFDRWVDVGYWEFKLAESRSSSCQLETRNS